MTLQLRRSRWWRFMLDLQPEDCYYSITSVSSAYADKATFRSPKMLLNQQRPQAIKEAEILCTTQFACRIDIGLLDDTPGHVIVLQAYIHRLNLQTP